MSDGDKAVRAGVVQAVGAIGLATLASRVLGYVRDIVLAQTFGAGPVTDAFFVAFRIPNLLRRLLAEGALSTAIIPVFSETLARGGPASFARMVRAVAGAGTVVLCAVSALGMLLAPWIVAVMAPGWRSQAGLFDLAVTLTRTMFPYLLLVGLAALAMGALNSHHRFFTAALAPAVLNIAMIAAVLGLAGRMTPPIMALAVGVLAGGLGQFLVQLPELRRLGVPLMPALDWSHPAVRQVARRLWPAVFSLAAVQVTVIVNTLLASLLQGGTVSYLYYADRVMEFPLGVFGIALATAILPTMSAQAARGQREALRSTLSFALRLSAFIAVPAAVGLVVLGGPIVRLLLQRGEFGAQEAMYTAQALAGYAVGLPAFSATRIAAQTFYALGDTRTPVIVGAVSVAANAVFALSLMWPLEASRSGARVLAVVVRQFPSAHLAAPAPSRRTRRRCALAIAGPNPRRVGSAPRLVCVVRGVAGRERRRNRGGPRGWRRCLRDDRSGGASARVARPPRHAPPPEEVGVKHAGWKTGPCLSSRADDRLRHAPAVGGDRPGEGPPTSDGPPPGRRCLCRRGSRPLMDPVAEFLETLQMERGASRNTLSAYRSDLAGYRAFLGKGGRRIEDADLADVGALPERAQAARPGRPQPWRASSRRCAASIAFSSRPARSPATRPSTWRARDRGGACRGHCRSRTWPR